MIGLWKRTADKNPSALEPASRWPVREADKKPETHEVVTYWDQHYESTKGAAVMLAGVELVVREGFSDGVTRSLRPE